MEELFREPSLEPGVLEAEREVVARERLPLSLQLALVDLTGCDQQWSGMDLVDPALEGHLHPPQPPRNPGAAHPPRCLIPIHPVKIDAVGAAEEIDRAHPPRKELVAGQRGRLFPVTLTA